MPKRLIVGISRKPEWLLTREAALAKFANIRNGYLNLDYKMREIWESADLHISGKAPGVLSAPYILTIERRWQFRRWCVTLAETFYPETQMAGMLRSGTDVGEVSGLYFIVRNHYPDAICNHVEFIRLVEKDLSNAHSTARREDD